MKPSSPPVSMGPAMYPPGIIETAARLNRNYVSWEGLKERHPGDDSLLDIWRIMTAIRSATAEIVNVGGTVFSWNRTASMTSDMHYIDMRNSPEDVFGHMGKRELKALLEESLAEEAISSCLIAGCMISRNKMMKRLREGRIPIGRYEKTLHETVDMLKRAVEYSSEPLSAELLEHIAGMDIREDDIVIPEPHSHEPENEPFRRKTVDRALSDLAVFVDDDSIHPVIRAFSIEYMIMRIAPFRTGNGRVGRAMAVWCFERFGYPSVKYLPISRYRNRWRDHYVKAFATSWAEHDDVTYAVSFCLTSLVKTAMRINDERRTENGNPGILPPDTESLTDRRKAILSWITAVKRPVALKEVSSKYAVSYQTARTDMIALIDAGFIEKDGREGHKDVFVASESVPSDRNP